MTEGFVFENYKKIVLYGASSRGEKVFNYFYDMKMDNKILSFCDSDQKKCNNEIKFCGKSVISPKELIAIKEDILVVISSTFLEEISNSLEKMNCKHDIVSSLAVKWAIHADIYTGKAKYLDNDIICWYKNEYEYWKNIEMEYANFTALSYQKKCIRDIWNSTNPIILHSRHKTGNNTLWLSTKHYNNVFFSYHYIDPGKYNDYQEVKLIIESKKKRGETIRILCGIREPVSMTISQSWQAISRPYCYQNSYLTNDFPFSMKFGGFWNDTISTYKNNVYYWYYEQLKKPFGIDLFDTSLDLCDKLYKGYIIIKKSNIELFLYKTESLNLLEKEIGEFIGDSQFSMKNENCANKSPYALAYKQYKEVCKIPKEWFEFQMNQASYFYTVNECKSIRKKYEKYIY